MKVLFIGSEPIFKEWKKKIIVNTYIEHWEEPKAVSKKFDYVFDSDFDMRRELPQSFIYPTENVLVGSAVKRTLKQSNQLFTAHIGAEVVGMNMLPFFVSQENKEVAFLNQAVSVFEEFCISNSWKVQVVKDTIGMVTPRVIAMIINEAANLLAEETATKEDIDRGMMLGTSFPHGPLKWCDMIGVRHIVGILSALKEATGDERYNICPLLKKMAADDETFY